MVDHNLADEALYLADGADVHDVTGLVGIYRSLEEPGDVLDELERELRSFVVRKRLEQQLIGSTVCQQLREQPW